MLAGISANSMPSLSRSRSSVLSCDNGDAFHSTLPGCSAQAPPTSPKRPAASVRTTGHDESTRLTKPEQRTRTVDARITRHYTIVNASHLYLCSRSESSHRRKVNHGATTSASIGAVRNGSAPRPPFLAGAVGGLYPACVGAAVHRARPALHAAAVHALQGGACLSSSIVVTSTADSTRRCCARRSREALSQQHDRLCAGLTSSKTRPLSP